MLKYTCSYSAHDTCVTVQNTYCRLVAIFNDSEHRWTISARHTLCVDDVGLMKSWYAEHSVAICDLQRDFRLASSLQIERKLD